jgi:hypothetical protein
LIETDYNQICKACEREGIQWLVNADAGEVTQAESFQLEISPLFTWR